MDIIWIIFAGLMFCGISKKKPGLMVPFIGLVGLTNVVRTSPAVGDFYGTGIEIRTRFGPIGSTEKKSLGRL